MTMGDLKERDQLRERELSELYAQVEHKDTIMSECERRLVRNLKEKEQEIVSQLKRVDALETEKRDLKSKVEYLERTNEDRNLELTKVKNSVDSKKSKLEEL